MTYRYEMMRNLAFVESKNLVLVNQVGGSTDIVYDGTSGALNSRGELVLMMKNFEEDFQIFDTKASARPISIPSTYNDRTRLVYEAARCGLRDFFRKNGYRKASIRAWSAASTRPWWPRLPPMRWGRRMSARC